MTKSHPILLPLTLVVVFQINLAMTILVCPQGNERIAPQQYCDNQVDCSIGLDDVNTDFFLNGGHCLSKRDARASVWVEYAHVYRYILI